MKPKPYTLNKGVYATNGASQLEIDLNTVSGMYPDGGHIIVMFDSGLRYKADEVVFRNIEKKS